MRHSTHNLTQRKPRGRLDPEVLAEDRSEGTWSQDLRVPEDLGCWPGHFPGQPLVPGVLQLDWVMALAARRLGRPPRVARIAVLKFTSPLGPGRRFTLQLAAEGGGWFRFRLHDQETLFSLGRFQTVTETGAES